MFKLLVLAGVLWFFLSGCALPKQPLEIRSISLGGQKLQVELAKTSKQLAQGLSGRTGLCQNCGMLFWFNNLEPRTFWMKGMRFSLDIIWLIDDELAGFVQNVSILDLAGGINTVSSPLPVNRVLELPAGWIKKNNPQAGEKIIWLD